jgi:hypothetical protein
VAGPTTSGGSGFARGLIPLAIALVLLTVGATSYLFGIELADWRYLGCGTVDRGTWSMHCWTPMIWFYSGVGAFFAGLALPIWIGVRKKLLRPKAWAAVGLGCLAVSLTMQSWLERTHRVDSIGLWFTMLRAAIYTLIALASVAVIATLWHAIRPSRSPASPPAP